MTHRTDQPHYDWWDSSVNPKALEDVILPAQHLSSCGSAKAFGELLFSDEFDSW